MPLLVPILSCSNLASSVIMLGGAAFLVNKVYKGSKSRFAYWLIAFTFTDGLVNLAFFVEDANPETYLINNQTNYFLNFYAFATINYFYLQLSLQSWIFAMRYLESAVNSSFETGIANHLTHNRLQFIRWSVIILYELALTSAYLIVMISFPGYDNNGSLLEF